MNIFLSALKFGAGQANKRLWKVHYLDRVVKEIGPDIEGLVKNRFGA